MGLLTWKRLREREAAAAQVAVASLPMEPNVEEVPTKRRGRPKKIEEGNLEQFQGGD